MRKTWSSFIIKENYAFYTICFYLIMMLLHALCLYACIHSKEYAELCVRTVNPVHYTVSPIHKTQFV